MAFTHALTDAAIAAAVIPAGQKRRKLVDGHGLSLWLQIDGKRRWVQRLAGSDKVLGHYPAMSIEAARQAADALRGKAPAPAASVADAVAATLPAAPPAEAPVTSDPTFGAVGREWLARARRTEATAVKHRILFAHLAPLHGTSYTQVSRKMVRDTLRAIEAAGKRSTARRAGAVAAAILRYGADVLDLPPNNAAVSRTDWIEPHVERHHAALTDPQALGALLRSIDSWRSRKGCYTSGNATRLQARLAVRNETLCGALWSEFKDLDKPELARWEIPAERMKGGTHAFIVPLAPQAVAILAEQRLISGNVSRYVFPQQTNMTLPMEQCTLRDVLKALSMTDDMSHSTASPHGWRTSLQTLALEASDRAEHPSRADQNLIDLCLAHKEPNAVRRAYNRAERMDARRALMVWWADEIERLKAG